MVKVTLGLSFISDLIYDFQVDYRSKCRRQTIKVLEENNSGNLSWNISNRAYKAVTIRIIQIYSTTLKLRICIYQKTTLKESKKAAYNI